MINLSNYTEEEIYAVMEYVYGPNQVDKFIDIMDDEQKINTINTLIGQRIILDIRIKKLWSNIVDSIKKGLHLR